MQMLRLVCEHLQIHTPESDKESKEMARITPVSELVEEIEKARDVDKASGANTQ